MGGEADQTRRLGDDELHDNPPAGLGLGCDDVVCTVSRVACPLGGVSSVGTAMYRSTVTG